MTVSVGPTEKNPSHVFSLSDGTDTIGFITCNRQGIKSVVDGWAQSPMPRTALKTSSGSAKYEDFELPFTSIIQDDFSGGMNAEEFEDDRTKYRNGRHCDTMLGDIICGPLPVVTTEIGSDYSDGDLSYDASGEDDDDGTDDYLFVSKYTPTSTITVESITGLCEDWFAEFKVYIYSSSGGAPDTLLASGEVSSPGIWGQYTVYLDTAQELTESTLYYIGVTGWINETPQRTVHYSRNETGDSIYYKTNTVGWTEYLADNAVPFQINGLSAADKSYKFFEYQRLLYAVANVDDGSAPELYRNGYIGAASSNSSDKSKLNTDQDLSGATLEGCIAAIIDGPGSLEKQPWRVVSSNTTTGTNDVITVEQPWKIAHTVATTWIVIGTDDWIKLTSTALTKPVTDVVVCNDYVVFLQGLDDYIQQYAADNNSGAWRERWFESAHSADYGLVVENTEGEQKFWIANRDENTVYYSAKVDYGTDWTLSDHIWIGNKDSRIQGMIAYGDPRIPYVFKEDSFGSIENDIYAEVPVGEMRAIRSPYNGNATMAHGVYLYFNMGEKIERYYDRRLDDVGPDRSEGRPEELKGAIRKLLPYPGRYYALLYTDGNVASILCFNGIGWFELWRPTNVTSDGSGDTGDAAPFAYNVNDRANIRSNDMAIQVIPGRIIDRLWFDFGGEIYYLPIGINPRKETNYTYKDLSQIETSWIYGNLKDVNKYWHSIKIHSENLSGTDQSIKIEYMVDEDTSWTTAGYADTSPIDEIDLSSSYNVTGYRIKFRLTLHTSDSSETPRVIALVIKGVVRVDVKKGWNVTVISDAEYDLNGDEDDQGDIKSYLDTWANSETQAAPLTLRHNISYYDNKYVFIDPASVALQQVELAPDKNSADRQYKEIISFAMYEV